MGYAIATNAMERGAMVTLISGPVNIESPMFVNAVNVTSAKDMYDAVMENLSDCDILIKAAAVADYTPAAVSNEKMKKKDNDMSIELMRTKDILKDVGNAKRDNQVVCGFSMETCNMLENSKKKLVSKKCDMIVANNLKDEGAGFGVDTNKVTIIMEDGVKELELMTKSQVGDRILDEAVTLWKKKNGGL